MSEPKKVRSNVDRLRRQLLAGAGALSLYGAGVLTGKAFADTQNIYIEPKSFSGPYSYLIETDGTYVWAKDGKTGQVAFGGPSNAGGVSGTDATSVIQQALNALTPWRTWKEKVVLKGGFTLNNVLKIPSYTILEGCLIKLKDGAIFTDVNPRNISYLAIRNQNWVTDQVIDHDIEIRNMIIDGNGLNQINDYYMLMFGNCYNVKLANVKIVDARAYCIGSVEMGNAYVDNIEVVNSYFSRDASLPQKDACSFEAFKLRFLNNYILNGNGSGITTAWWEDTIISKNYIESTSLSVSIEPPQANKNIVISDNVLVGVSGVALNYAEKVVIKGNIIKAKSANSHLIRFYSPAKNTIIEGNIIDGLGLPNVYGLSFEATSGSNHTITLVNNIIRDTGYDGISCTNQKLVDSILAFNLITNTGHNGAIYAEMDNPIIVGNKIINNGGYGIYDAGGSGGIIAFNDLTGNLGPFYGLQSSRIVAGNNGYNPQSASAPTVPSSPATFGPYPYHAMVVVYGGTVSNISIRSLSTGLTSGTFYLYPGDTITITYTVAPTVKIYPQ
jgi:hypothetical protein